jgi:ubiquinone/menaquinone biosynthesis C-methylase UbiE
MDNDTRKEQIREDYAVAVEEGECLCCTNDYEGVDLSYIPCEVLCAGQGCGSPLAAVAGELQEGMAVVDLGCGAGLDVFIASKAVGENGHVTGIDMTPEMLKIARENAASVASALGYKKPNTSFLEAPIENMPLPDGEADLVTSNCVVNLSADKAAVFAEMHRILKPGGAFVLSDVFAETPVPAHMQKDRELISRCIGGAMTFNEALALAKAAGFTEIRELSRNRYETIEGINFTSATISGSAPRSGGGAAAAKTEAAFLFHQK